MEFVLLLYIVYHLMARILIFGISISHNLSVQELGQANWVKQVADMFQFQPLAIKGLVCGQDNLI